MAAEAIAEAEAARREAPRVAEEVTGDKCPDKADVRPAPFFTDFQLN